MIFISTDTLLAEEIQTENVHGVEHDVCDETPPTSDVSLSDKPDAVTPPSDCNQTRILCFVLLVAVAMFASLVTDASLLRMVAGVASGSVMMFYFLGV